VIRKAKNEWLRSCYIVVINVSIQSAENHQIQLKLIIKIQMMLVVREANGHQVQLVAILGKAEAKGL